MSRNQHDAVQLPSNPTHLCKPPTNLTLPSVPYFLGMNLDSSTPLAIDTLRQLDFSCGGIFVLLLAYTSGAEGGIESFPKRCDHLVEPVKVQHVESQIGRHVAEGKPQRHLLLARKLHDLSLRHQNFFYSRRVDGCGVITTGQVVRNTSAHESSVDIVSHSTRLPGAPDQTATEEGTEKKNAVDKLSSTTGHSQLVEEPVEIEERRGELVENERWPVVVHEWSLCQVSFGLSGILAHSSPQAERDSPGKLTKPSENTDRALIA
jgi:hypothetical protein